MIKQRIDKIPFRSEGIWRTVEPYQHKYTTYAKTRWVGVGLLEVLANQFKAYSREYYAEAIATGKIVVNGTMKSADYAFKQGDFLEHTAIRHQPPVVKLPVKIVHQSDDFIVVDKPAGIAVHAGGSQHYNTLVEVLKLEQGRGDLWVVHRLDRVTSGVLVMAKSKEQATKFHKLNHQHEMAKTYLARVSGKFPTEPFEVDQPIIVHSYKQGLFGVGQGGKKARTKFELRLYCEQNDSSLVECRPVTGRTHQIRVHLKHAGFPILNDVWYGGRFIGNRSIQHYYPEHWPDYDPCQRPSSDPQCEQPKCKKQILEDKVELKKQVVEQGWDGKHSPLQICLHALRYAGEGMVFTTDPPFWASPDWKFEYADRIPES